MYRRELFGEIGMEPVVGDFLCRQCLESRVDGAAWSLWTCTETRSLPALSELPL